MRSSARRTSFEIPTTYSDATGFGEVGATPLPNPPPQGGREFQRSIRPSNPCPQRCRSSQSSAICGLSKLRRFPQPDSRGTRPGMTCWGCKRRSRIRSLKPDDELVQQLLGRADIDGFKAFGDLFVYGLQYPPGVDQLSLR